MRRLPRIDEFTPDARRLGILSLRRQGNPADAERRDSAAVPCRTPPDKLARKLADDIERFKDEFDVSEFVRVEARAVLFQGQPQFLVTHIRRVNPPQDRLQGFREEECVLSAPRSIDEMWARASGPSRARA